MESSYNVSSTIDLVVIITNNDHNFCPKTCKKKERIKIPKIPRTSKVWKVL